MLTFHFNYSYLGQVVSRYGINHDRAKLKKIIQWPKRVNGTRFAFLLGLCNFYRNLNLSFAYISNALYIVTRAD